MPDNTDNNGGYNNVKRNLSLSPAPVIGSNDMEAQDPLRSGSCA